jgi:hypothetical protein
MTAPFPTIPPAPVAPPPAAPDIGRLRLAAGLISLVTVIMAIAMIVFCFVGDAAPWMAAPFLIWAISPPALAFYVMKRNLRVRAAWWFGLVGLGAYAAFQAWVTHGTFVQMLIAHYGYRFEGVEGQSLYGLAALFGPLYFGPIVIVTLIVALVVERRARVMAART